MSEAIRAGAAGNRPDDASTVIGASSVWSSRGSDDTDEAWQPDATAPQQSTWSSGDWNCQEHAWRTESWDENRATPPCQTQAVAVPVPVALSPSYLPPDGSTVLYLPAVPITHPPLQIWHTNTYQTGQSSSLPSSVEPSYIPMPPTVPEDTPKAAFPAARESQPWTIRQPALDMSQAPPLIDELADSDTYPETAQGAQTLVDSSQVQSAQDPLPGPPNCSVDPPSIVQAPVEPTPCVSAVPAAAAPANHLLAVQDVGGPPASHTSLEHPLAPAAPAAPSASGAPPPSATIIDTAKGSVPQEHTPPTSIGSDTVSSCCASEVGGQVPRPLSPASAKPNPPLAPTRPTPPAIPSPKLKARREQYPEVAEPAKNPERHREIRALREEGSPLPPPSNARQPSADWRDLQHFPQIGRDGSATSGCKGEAESSNLSSPSSNVHERGVLEQPDGGQAIADNRESDVEGLAAQAPGPTSSLASTGSPSPTDVRRGAATPADVLQPPVEVASSVMHTNQDEPPRVSPESTPTTTGTGVPPTADSDSSGKPHGFWRDLLGSSWFWS